MNRFITNIKINQLYHLHDINIPIPENNSHLLITGKNGSGKTILLKALADFLELVRNSHNLDFLEIDKHIQINLDIRDKSGSDAVNKTRFQNSVDYWLQKKKQYFGKVSADINSIAEIYTKIKNGDFIYVYYPAERKTQMLEPKNPTKPNLKDRVGIRSLLTDQFLYFLSDLKIQEALARNEGQVIDANNIKDWFDNFEGLMKDIYQDNKLRLIFNYKDYSFKINTNSKEFKFTEMSDGFVAAIDIVADLILKMQSENSVVRKYEKEGIVLIDEIETHLHLELQRIILPLLTRIFPNIQFIVTTHSPFVLNSMDNAVAYDMEHREIINDLTEYSYEALAEGYFGVDTDSSYMKMRLSEFEKLLSKSELTLGDKETLRNLKSDFEKIPEAVSPLLIGRFRELVIKYSEILKSL